MQCGDIPFELEKGGRWLKRHDMTNSSLENALIAPACLGGLANLVLSGIRVHNADLPSDLVLVPLTV